MWTAERERRSGGEELRPFEDGRALSFGRYLDLLGRSDGFCAWYTALLADSPYAAFFWEHPPLTRATVGADARFALLDAPALEKVAPDPAPFADQFRRRPDTDVLTFDNLGGDAALVVPRPMPGSPGAAHLAAFLRQEGAMRTRRLWRVTVAAVLARLGSAPLWLSTSGLGVFWPHLRLDSRPKYYQHAPYRRLGGHKRARSRFTRRGAQCEPGGSPGP